jgi:Na+/H+-dicarboxylate symporter
MGMKSAVRSYFKFPVIYKIAIGLVLGLIVGLIVGPPIAVVKPVGDFFVRLLKLCIMPLVFFALTAGAASLSPSTGARMGAKAIGFYVATTVFAAAFGIGMALLMKPGVGMELAGEGVVKEAAAVSVTDFILRLITTNPFAALAAGDMLPTVIFTILLGLALAMVKESPVAEVRKTAETAIAVFEAGRDAIIRIIYWIMEYAPYGVFALLAYVIGTQGAKVIGPLGMVTLTLYAALIIHLFVIYGGILTAYGLNFFRFMAGARDAAITAFITRSSGATLPVSLRCATEKLGVDKRLASFAIPIGNTINMDGTCMYTTICAIYVAQAVGATVTGTQMASAVLTATFVSIGCVGLPGVGVIILIAVLASIGLPLEPGPVALAYAGILGIDAILDMGRTSLNNIGDLAMTSVVAKSEHMLNLDLWRRPKEAVEKAKA